MCLLLQAARKQAQSKTNFSECRLWLNICLDVLLLINQRALVECKFLFYGISKINEALSHVFCVWNLTQRFTAGES